MATRTKLFSGFGKGLTGKYWKGATIRECFKFSIYISIPIFAICNFGGYEVASKKIEFIQSIFQPDAKKAKKLKAPDFNKDPTFQFVVPAEYKDMVEADQKTKEVEATAASK